MENVILKGKTKVLDVPIDKVRMAAYQRRPSANKVKRIVEEFDEHRFRPVELSYRDGQYWCFDGQHRIRVCQIMKQPFVRAQVHFGLTYEQEAFLFAEQHRNETHIAKRDEWMARLESGKEDKGTCDIVEAVESFGYKIIADGRHGDACKTIGTVRELQKVYAHHGKQGIKDLMFVVDTAWNGAPYATHRDIIAGLVKIMDTYCLTNEQWNRLRDRLAKTTPKKLMEEAAMRSGRGGKRMAICICEWYNGGLRLNSKMRLNSYQIH